MTSEATATGVRPHCRLGGSAPCIDDLCHSGGPTLCGLDLWDSDEQTCTHGFYEDTCSLCRDLEDDDATYWDALDRAEGVEHGK